VSLSVGVRWGTWGGVHLLGLLRDGERGLQIWSISLCGRSVRETWKGGSFTGDPGGCVNEGSGDGISPHRGPAGKLGRGLVYRGRGKMNEGGLEEWGISL